MHLCDMHMSYKIIYNVYELFPTLLWGTILYEIIYSIINTEKSNLFSEFQEKPLVHLATVDMNASNVKVGSLKALKYICNSSTQDTESGEWPQISGKLKFSVE